VVAKLEAILIFFKSLLLKRNSIFSIEKHLKNKLNLYQTCPK